MPTSGEPRTRVVHVRKEKFDVYIGRDCSEFCNEGWGNPFHIGPDGDRAEVLEFRNLCESDPLMVSLIKKELRGKVLGCWCHPQTCHGDVLAEIADKEY
jgi:hypothetical protein